MHFLTSSNAISRHLLFFTFACAATLNAQIAVPVGPATQLAPVIVQGRDTDLVGVATSASQGIVGAAELDARPFLRRGELLEVIPGVVVTQHSGDGKANQYFLRGFNLDHGTDFSVTVDGMPVNMRSHAHGQGYADLNFLIPELVKQVDYNKGPFYADVGDFSAAGAAEFRQFSELPQNFAALTFGGNNYSRVAIGATLRSGNTADTGGVEFTHDDGPWLLRENANRFNGLLRRQWITSTSDYRVTMMAYRGQWRSTDQIPLRAVDSGALERFGNLDPTDGGESERASVSFDGLLKDAPATTRFNAYAIYYRLNLFSDFTYFLEDPVNGDQFNQRDRRWLIGGTLARTWSGMWDGKTETTVGTQGRVDFIRELGLFHTVRRARLSTVRDDDVNEASIGAFVKNDTRWNDWFRTHAGLRSDGYRFKVESDHAQNSGQRLADIFSPKIGLAIGPWEKMEFYANAGYGFHSNDARGTTIHVEPPDGLTPVNRVTPLVRSRGIEIGGRAAAVPGLVSSVSAWALDLDSELVFVGDAGGTEATGRTRRYGIELANFYRVKPWLTLDGDLAFTHSRYRDNPSTGTRIANSIATVVTAGASLGNKEGFFGNLRLRYFGPQPLAEDNSVRAPLSLTVNAQAGWRGKTWEAAVDMLNVLNRKNYDIAYFYTSRLRGEPLAGVDDLHFHPAEPITLRVSLTRRF